ncbi:MAG: hypothetical protein QOJ81_2094 [Chloroflexota bacterium]|nr:hypothetical protein [Chloroflexota bacterium]
MTPARPKQHREFFAVPHDGAALGDVRWQPVSGHEGWISEVILADNLDEQTQTGSRTRLARWQPRTLLPEQVRHDYREEILLLSGDLVVGCDAEGNGGEQFEPLTFAARPAGIWHGPFTTRKGCLMLELDIYEG